MLVVVAVGVVLVAGVVMSNAGRNHTKGGKERALCTHIDSMYT